MSYQKSAKTPMILIVDDVSKNIQVAANFLKPEGYQLAFAQNGKTAIDQAQSKPIDLILLDVMMPEMDGFEVCSYLKSSSTTQNIPIIFLTGKIEPEDVVRGFDVGGVDYVTKPFNREELLARIRTHLELKQSREHIQTLYEQMADELDVASEIQKSVMREKPEVDFASVDLVFQPLGKVSGDIADFSTKGEHELSVFIGDATGHGIPAALITMMAPCILDRKTEHERAHETLARINEGLTHRNIEGNFITGIYAKINSDGQLFSCNAGHPPMIILPADGSPPIQFVKTGMAMGMFSRDLIFPYEEEEYALKLGDKLFIYTDGVTEWRNPKKEFFGTDRLSSCLENNRELDAHSILEVLMKEIKDFSKDVPCNDDYTIMCLEYLGKPYL